jgi:hypothetical protein
MLRASGCNFKDSTLQGADAVFMPGHRSALWIVLFLLLAAALVLPFYAVNAPPMLDYPNHLARTFILAHLHDPAYHFAESYRADWKPYPYILWDVLVVAAERVFPVEQAGKLVLSFATLLLPLSVAWFLRQANRSEMKLSFLACAFSYCTLFLWGFTAYQLSVAFCFLMVGTWLWYRERPSVARAALFAIACFLAYFAHLLGFASAAFILVLYELTRWQWRWWLRLAAFLAPPSLLFLWARPGLSERRGVEMRPLVNKLLALRDIPVHTYNDTLDQVYLWGLVLCLLVAVVRNRELRVNWRWLAVSAGFFAVYLLLPYGWGTSFDVDVRFVPPLWMLSLAVLKVGKRGKWIALLAIVLTLVRIFNVATGFRDEAQRNLAMDHGIAHIERNATVFPVVDTCNDEDPLNYYYVHYWAYTVIRRGAISPYLFDIPGQTPMRFTGEMYTSAGYWGHCYDVEPEWEQVAEDYNYIWSYGDQRFSRGIATVADKVFEESPLVLYRVRER